MNKKQITIVCASAMVIIGGAILAVSLLGSDGKESSSLPESVPIATESESGEPVFTTTDVSELSQTTTTASPNESTITSQEQNTQESTSDGNQAKQTTPAQTLPPDEFDPPKTLSPGETTTAPLQTQLPDETTTAKVTNAPIELPLVTF